MGLLSDALGCLSRWCQDLDVGLQPTDAAREAGYIDDAKPEHKAQAGHNFEGLDRCDYE